MTKSRDEETAGVREAMAAVFADLQAEAEGGGDHAHLKAWALAHPTDFYRLWARLKETAGDGAPALTPDILAAFENLGPGRRAALRRGLAAALK